MSPNYGLNVGGRGMNLLSRVVVLSATCALLGACASESPETVASVPKVATATQSTESAAPSVSPSPAEVEVSAASTREIADAIAIGGDPDAIREAMKFTAADSVANAYLLHRSYLAEAGLDGGSAYSDSEVTELSGGEYKVCDDPTNEKTCAVLGDFKADASGKIVDFTVAGKPLKGRLTVGNGQKVKAGGGAFTFLTAYKTITSNALDVTVKMESGGKALSPNIYSATYRGPDGKQRTATDAVGPTELDADSNSVASFSFKGVKPGGKVTLEGCVEDCDSSFKAVIKVG